MADLKVYTLEEVCAILKVTKRTVYSYIKADKLHAVKMGKQNIPALLALLPQIYISRS